MSNKEVTIIHKTLHVDTKTKAFGLGFAEGLGKALSYAIVFIGVTYFLASWDMDEKLQSPNKEQHQKD